MTYEFGRPTKDLPPGVIDHPGFIDDRPPPAEPKKEGSPWAGIFAATTILFALLWIRTLIPVTDGETDEDPDVEPVSGAYVAMFYEKGKLDDYSKEAREALMSVEITNVLEQAEANWLKIDVEQDLSKLDDVFRRMADMHRSKMPWAVAMKGRKVSSEPITSTEQLKALLERRLK